MAELIAAFSADVEALCQELCTGKISVSEWHLRMRRLVKRLHVAAALIAGELRGELVEEQVREQFEYLAGFAESLREQGEILCGPLIFRALMYSGAAWATFWLVVEALEVEATEVRWRLTPAEHCDDCLALAARGWMLREQLTQVPGDGQTECLTNCRCYLEFR